MFTQYTYNRIFMGYRFQPLLIPWLVRQFLFHLPYLTHGPARARRRPERAAREVGPVAVVHHTDVVVAGPVLVRVEEGARPGGVVHGSGDHGRGGREDQA